MIKGNDSKEDIEIIDKDVDSISDSPEDGENSNLEAIQSELEEDSNENNDDFSTLKQEYEEKLNSKEKELQELNDMFLRLKADFSNYKRRMDKEKEAIYSFAAEGFITPLLEILDNFERAMISVNEQEKSSSLYQGVEMIYNQLLEALKKSGLEEINALYEKFDPNFHHGVAQEHSDDHEEDTVLEVFQKGYKFREKVIRPSMVKISKK